MSHFQRIKVAVHQNQVGKAEQLEETALYERYNRKQNVYVFLDQFISVRMYIFRKCILRC